MRTRFASVVTLLAAAALVLAVVSVALGADTIAADRTAKPQGARETIAYSVWLDFAAPEAWLAGGGLCLARADGRGSFRLTGPEYDVDPTWSPDGTRVAFSSAGARPQPHGYDVHVLDVARNAVTGITTVGGDWDEFNLTPAWSPDGTSLALSVGKYQQWIVVYDLATGDAYDLGPGFIPSWSPDGRRLAYTHATPVETSVIIADVEGSGAGQVIRDASDPDFSPDEMSLVYVNADNDIVVAGADGSDPRQLVVTPERESGPAWSPDGTRIAFARTLESGSAIVVASVANSTETVVVRSPFLVSGPAWRPGGGIPAGSPPCFRNGRATADRIVGTATSDVVLSHAGADRILGRDGRDALDGGPGEDLLRGESGNDLLLGRAGSDVLEGGTGFDSIIGGLGRDLLLGGDGRDTIWARDGDADRVACGRGRDYVHADFRDTWTADCEAVSRRVPVKE